MSAFRSALLGAAASWLSLGLASDTRAAPVDVTFQAVVRAIYPTYDPTALVWAETSNDLESLGVSVGAPVQGSLRYDNAAPWLGGGYYDAAGVEFAFEVGLIDAFVTPEGSRILMALALPNGDELVQLGGALDLGMLTGTDAGGASLVLVGALEDWADGSLPSALPELGSLVPFDLESYLDPLPYTFSTAWGFGFNRCSGPTEQVCQTVTVVGEITELEPVPEPNLLSLGLVSAALLASRRTSSRRRSMNNLPRSDN